MDPRRPAPTIKGRHNKALSRGCANCSRRLAFQLYINPLSTHLQAYHVTMLQHMVCHRRFAMESLIACIAVGTVLGGRYRRKLLSICLPEMPWVIVQPFGEYDGVTLEPPLGQKGRCGILYRAPRLVLCCLDHKRGVLQLKPLACTKFLFNISISISIGKSRRGTNPLTDHTLVSSEPSWYSRCRSQSWSQK